MSTNYIKRLYFDTSNNVGVGTDRPQAALDVSGNISCANIIASGNISCANIIASGNIVPGSNISYDLGSSTNRWRDIYLSGSTIDLSGTKIQRQDNGGIKVVDASGGTVDGTFNNVTIDGAINQSSTLDVSGSILPTSNLIYDLGSDTNRWRDIYLSGSTIDLSGTKLARHTNGNLMVKNTSGTMLGVTMDHIDLNGTIIRRHTDGSVVVDNGSGGRVTGRFGDLDVSGNISGVGNIDVSGNISGAGNIDVSGNVIASGNISASNLIVGNNLTVNGTTTTINSTTVTVQDPIITLGSDITNTKDKGIEFKYGTNKIGFFGYDDSTGNFSFLKDASNNSEIFNGTQGTLEGLTFKSTVVSGTAPLTVTSTTVVSNLNADLLDGLNSDKFMRTDISTSTTGNISAVNITSTGTLSSSSTITGTRLISNIASGTAPLSVTSTTVVTNLNADLLDGLNSDKFMRTDANTSTTGTLSSSSTITGTRLISNIASGTAPLTVTSTTVVTNLNADLLDGLNSDKFMRTDINTSSAGSMTITGNVGIGTATPQAKLHVNDTGAMIIPVGTTAQIPSTPALGMIRYNTTTNKLQYYNPTGWNSIGGVSALGGNTTVDINGYRIHIFTSSSTFTVYMGGTVEYLVVAGGGGGGCRFGGGGGAGGLLYNNSYILPNGSHIITIGAGGAGGPTNNTRGVSGNNSSIGSLIYTTGGGGGASETVLALSGGSGGGATYQPSYLTPGTGTSGQGFTGGTGQSSVRVNGGGGGAGELGKGSGNRPDGGNGLQLSISGTNTYYAGGGGGADNRVDSAGFGGPTAGNGGLGGGGQGGGGESNGQADARSGTGVSGTTNTGGGGGGGSYIPTLGGGRPGGAGGSGIVIIRYLI